MKTQLILMALLTVSFLAAAEADSAGSEEDLAPQDQPNFEPKIAKMVLDGKNVETVEFNCKLSK